MNMRTYLLLTHRYRLLMNLIMIILDNSIIFHTEPGQVWLCQLLDIFQRHHFSANSAKQRYFPETPFQWYLEIPKQNREEQRPSDCRARVAELVKGKGLSLLSSIKLFKLFSSSNFTLMFLNREKLIKVFSGLSLSFSSSELALRGPHNRSHEPMKYKTRYFVLRQYD